MKQTKHGLTAVLLCGLLVLCGCGAQNTAQDTSNTGTVSSEDMTATTVSTIDTAEIFSDWDLAGTYDESEAIDIQLNGNTASCDSNSVVIDGGTITITAEGIYRISGTLTDGQIVVDAGDTEKVQLVLAGADITSSTSAAIYALEADKVFITSAENTENTIVSTGDCVDSNGSLTINGGTLALT